VISIESIDPNLHCHLKITILKMIWRCPVGKRKDLFFSWLNAHRPKSDHSILKGTISEKETNLNSSQLLDEKSVQSPNRATIWSKSQQVRSAIQESPRFIDVNLQSQPRPLAAIELLKFQPIEYVENRTVACDGDGLLGHPRVFINLVTPFLRRSFLIMCGNK
jgi:hypothetical protein